MGTKSFLLTILIAYISEGWGQKDGFLKDCLEAHNKYRAEHGVPPLVWNQTLADEAERWANQLTQTNQFKHDMDSIQTKGEGENLAYFKPASPKCMGIKKDGCVQCREIVKDWYDEIGDYDFNQGKGKTPNSVVLHFTQVVWKGSTQLGMATGVGEKYGFTSVARYYPRGNMGSPKDFKDNVLSKGAVSTTTPPTVGEGPAPQVLPAPKIPPPPSTGPSPPIPPPPSTVTGPEGPGKCSRQTKVIKQKFKTITTIIEECETPPMSIPAGASPPMPPNKQAPSIVGPQSTTSPDTSAGPQPTTSPGTSPGPKPTTSPGKSPGPQPTTSPGTSPGPQPTTSPGKSPGPQPTTSPGTSPGPKPTTSPGKSPGAQPTTSPGKSPGPQPTTSPGTSPGPQPTTSPGTSPAPSPTVPPTKQQSTQKEFPPTSLKPTTAPLPTTNPGPAKPTATQTKANFEETTTDDFKKAGLLAHNVYRALHKAKPMTWSDTLAQQAQAWAEKNAQIGMKHASSAERNKAGENLAMLYGKYDQAARTATDMWYNEVKDYDYKNAKFSSKTGHFTQVVWNGSVQLGMGRARGKVDKYKDYVFVVARYSPAGNMQGDFENNVFPAKYTVKDLVAKKRGHVKHHHHKHTKHVRHHRN